MWHNLCRTFHPWCPCIKTRCLFYNCGNFCQTWNIETIIHQISLLSWKLKVHPSTHVFLMLSIVMGPYEYDQVFITMLLILITLQDEFLPSERNLQFCTLFHWHLNKLVDGVRRININFLFDCNRQVQFLIDLRPKIRHTFIKPFS